MIGITNANQPSNGGPLFDDSPSYSPNDSVAPAPEQGNLPESVIDVPIEKDSTPEPVPASSRREMKKTIAGSTWVGLAINTVLLIALLVSILQNQQGTVLNLFGWAWNFPIGVRILFAAILDTLTTALIGGRRMSDLRCQIRRGDS